MTHRVSISKTTAMSLVILLLVSANLMGHIIALKTASAQNETRGSNDENITFRHVLDNEPIEFNYKPDQTITDAVKTFHQTAENPYDNQPEAVTEGERLYDRLCAACHLKDGSGRIGPSLIDDKHNYERTTTDKGRFEIIYAGGAGAMQAFGRRITQDQILRIMAYLNELRDSGSGQ